MTDEKEIKELLQDNLHNNDSCIAKLTNGKTGRLTTPLNTKNTTDKEKIEKLIEEYIENYTWDLKDYIENLVKDFNSPLRLQNCKFYRGVDSSTKLVSNKIGPAPNPGDNRYNIQGEKCLYLIDNNINFLFEELNLPTLLIQEYNIPVNDFKVADLSSNNKTLHNSLGLAFEMTERGKTLSGYNIEEELEKRRKSKYLISQLLAKYFKECDWDGLYIPGVHGEPENHYCNLAIFGQIVDQWEKWTVGDYFLQTKI